MKADERANSILAAISDPGMGEYSRFKVLADAIRHAEQAEREQCARIADERAGGQAFKRGAAVRIAAAIRARSES